MEKILSVLSSLKGVVNVVVLPENDKSAISEMEERYENNQGLKLVNSGVRSVLARDTVIAVLKDTTFRPPVSPTVLLVEEIQREDEADEYTAVLDGKPYRIIGEEIFGGNVPSGEEHILLSSGFVMYPERRKGRSSVPSYFLMPSIVFPELEERKELFGIDNIVSASPSSFSDDYIRKAHNLSLDNRLATILVGFDVM